MFSSTAMYVNTSNMGFIINSTAASQFNVNRLYRLLLNPADLALGDQEKMYNFDGKLLRDQILLYSFISYTNQLQ